MFTGSIPTEIGLLGELSSLHLCKILGAYGSYRSFYSFLILLPCTANLFCVRFLSLALSLSLSLSCIYPVQNQFSGEIPLEIFQLDFLRSLDIGTNAR